MPPSCGEPASSFFLFTERGRPYRHLGWLFIALFVLMLVGQKSRPDRLAAAYTIVLAGGGTLLGHLAVGTAGRLALGALATALVVTGVLLAPLGIPLLSPETTARYAAAIGGVPQAELGDGKVSELPQLLADRFGWEQFVDDVASVVAGLDPHERRRTIIFAPSYGHAGAVEVLGRDRDLPLAYSGHNTNFFWGPPDEGVTTVVVIGEGEERLRRAVRSRGAGAGTRLRLLHALA